MKKMLCFALSLVVLMSVFCVEAFAKYPETEEELYQKHRELFNTTITEDSVEYVDDETALKIKKAFIDHIHNIVVNTNFENFFDELCYKSIDSEETRKIIMDSKIEIVYYLDMPQAIANTKPDDYLKIELESFKNRQDYDRPLLSETENFCKNLGTSKEDTQVYSIASISIAGSQPFLLTVEYSEKYDVLSGWCISLNEINYNIFDDKYLEPLVHTFFFSPEPMGQTIVKKVWVEGIGFCFYLNNIHHDALFPVLNVSCFLLPDSFSFKEGLVHYLYYGKYEDLSVEEFIALEKSGGLDSVKRAEFVPTSDNSNIALVCFAGVVCLASAAFCIKKRKIK